MWTMLFITAIFGEVQKLSFQETLSIDDPDLFNYRDAEKTFYILGTLPLLEDKNPKEGTPYLIKYEHENRVEWNRKLFTSYDALQSFLER